MLKYAILPGTSVILSTYNFSALRMTLVPGKLAYLAKSAKNMYFDQKPQTSIILR